ncbi:unnamed protein product [Eretmochelys imbricata]
MLQIIDGNPTKDLSVSENADDPSEKGEEEAISWAGKIHQAAKEKLLKDHNPLGKGGGESPGAESENHKETLRVGVWIFCMRIAPEIECSSTGGQPVTCKVLSHPYLFKTPKTYMT